MLNKYIIEDTQLEYSREPINLKLTMSAGQNNLAEVVGIAIIRLIVFIGALALFLLLSATLGFTQPAQLSTTPGFTQPSYVTFNISTVNINCGQCPRSEYEVISDSFTAQEESIGKEFDVDLIFDDNKRGKFLVGTKKMMISRKLKVDQKRHSQ